ncbi:type IV pilus modification protein PilV [Arenimonas composti]|nr:type IV pilus modification protein PilV [Arenimonas composti]
MHKSAPRPRHRNQAGVSLLEVLIAVLVLAIGMLGVAAMQATSLRNSQGSLERSQAVVLAYGIMDAMRANMLAARANSYNMTLTCTVPTAGTSLASRDLNAWMTSLQATVGASACGSVQCASNVCEVIVQWNDQRATGGIAAQQLRVRSRI